jgi:hypothetical protein
MESPRNMASTLKTPSFKFQKDEHYHDLSTYIMDYDLDNENISFSSWLTCQLGLQMISSKIADTANRAHLEKDKNCQSH